MHVTVTDYRMMYNMANKSIRTHQLTITVTVSGIYLYKAKNTLAPQQNWSGYNAL